MTDNGKLADKYLNDDAAVAEFDSLMAGYRRKRLFGGTLACVAAVLLAVGIAHMTGGSGTGTGGGIPTVEVLESISALADTGMGEFESITARPVGNGVEVTAEYADGKVARFFMKKDGYGIEMTAQN